MLSRFATCWLLLISSLCVALPGTRTLNLSLFCQYVDSGQETNVTNVIHAHTRRGNTRFQSVGDDPQSPRGRNSREFANIHDQGTYSTTQDIEKHVRDNSGVARPGPQPQMQQFLDGLISCSQRVAITCAPKGLSYKSLDAENIRLSPTGGRADWPPTLAADTVALIANSFHRIYAYSRGTGELLWTKNTAAGLLASDGNHFYIINTESWQLQALDPASGAVAWSVNLPPDPEGGFPAFLKFHNGLLFTVDCVIDIAKRAIVHMWPMGSSFVTSVGFDSNDNILIGSSTGTVTTYNKRFKRLWRVYVGKEYVVSLACAGRHILALLYISQRGAVPAHHVLTVLTDQAKQVWQVGWHSRIEGFAVQDSILLIVEPGKSQGEFQLTARELATGKVNWMSTTEFLFGWPIVCGSTAYVTDGNRLHQFDVHSGAEIESMRTAVGSEDNQ